MMLTSDHQRAGRAPVPQLAGHDLARRDAPDARRCCSRWAWCSCSRSGGLTGLFLADDLDRLYLHDTMFVVGHFHLTMAAATLLAVFAAIYFWFPKMFGRTMDERLGKLHFWLSVIGLTLIFGGQLAVGLRRAAAPAVGSAPVRVPAPPGAAVALDQLLRLRDGRSGSSPFVFNFFATVFSRAPCATRRNPWEVGTLEWTVPSPPAAPQLRRHPDRAPRPARAVEPRGAAGAGPRLDRAETKAGRHRSPCAACQRRHVPAGAAAR